MASVVGKDVPRLLLQDLAGAAEEPLRQSLRRLQAAEFVFEIGAGADPRVTFKHALTHEVTYGSLLLERRRELHGRTLALLEDLPVDRLSDRVERLAHHAVQGEVWDKAVTYLRQAGARAFSHSDYRLATAWFERTLDALAHVPDDRAARELAIDVRLDLRYALSPLGRFQRILDCLRDAEELAVGLRDQRRLGLVSASLANYFQVLGHLERAVQSGQRALAIAIEQRDRATQIAATAYLSMTYQTLGDYPRGIDLARQNLAVLTGETSRKMFGMPVLPAVYTRTALTRGLAEIGEFTEATAAAREGVAVAESVEHSYSLAYALLGRGVVELRRGQVDQAVETLEASFGLGPDWDSPTMKSLIAAFLGTAYAAAGRAEAAARALDEAMRQVTAAGLTGATLPHGITLAGLSEMHLSTGRPAEAAEVGRHALEAFEGLRARGYQAWTLRLLGAIDDARSEAEGAERGYRRALALAEELGMSPLVARCRLELGGLRRRTKPAGPWRDEVVEAARLFRALGMTSWALAAEEALTGPGRQSPVYSPSGNPKGGSA
jgi:tetratricopeptide (TPR) repeat protein